MGVGVSVGGGVFDDVGVGISVLVRVMGAITVTPGLAVWVNGRVRIIGVAVTMLGVREGGMIQVATGWGEISKPSHAPRKKIRTSRGINFFIAGLYSALFAGVRVTG